MPQLPESILLEPAFAPARAEFDCHKRLNEIYLEEKPEYADGAHGTNAPSTPVAAEVIEAHKEKIATFNFQFARLIAEIIGFRTRFAFTQRQLLNVATFHERIESRTYFEYQSNEFYKAVKQYLENIVCAIANPDPVAIKQHKTIMHDLLNYLAHCGTGVFSHLRNSSNLLTNKHCIETMLASLREIIVHQYADNHAHSNRMESSTYPHVYNVYFAHACEQGWQPLGTDEVRAINEYHANLAKVTEANYTAFKTYFYEQYNPFSIIQFITDFLIENFRERIQKGKKEVGTISFETLVDFSDFFAGLPLIGEAGILEVLFKLTENRDTGDFIYAGFHYQLREVQQLIYTLTRFYLRAGENRLFKGVSYDMDAHTSFTMVAGFPKLCYLYDSEKDHARLASSRQLEAVCPTAGVAALKENLIPISQDNFEIFLQQNITDFSACLLEEINLVNVPQLEKYDFSRTTFINATISARQFIFYKLHQCNQTQSTFTILDYENVTAPDHHYQTPDERYADLAASLLFSLELFDDGKLTTLLIQSGAELHSCNSSNLTPAEIACNNKRWAAIEAMADNVAACENVADRYRLHACLWEAMQQNNRELAFKLLMANADPKAAIFNNSAPTLLQWAAVNNYIELLAPLAKAGVIPCAYEVTLAAGLGHWNFVQRFAELFTTAELLPTYNMILIEALRSNNVAVAKTLIGTNCHVPKPGRKLVFDGSNVLHLAVTILNPVLIGLLIRSDVLHHELLTGVDEAGQKTPFAMACDSMDWECIKAFADKIKASENPDDKFGLGQGLILAAEFNQTAVAIALIEAGASTHAITYENGSTALHWACINDNSFLLQCLLQAKAFVHAPNDDGLTPHQLAGSLGQTACIELFNIYLIFQHFYNAIISQDFEMAKVILTENKNIFCWYAMLTKFGETALHLAAQHNLPELVTLLLEANADPAAINDNGHTPIVVAALHKCYAAVEAFVAVLTEDEDHSYGYGKAMHMIYTAKNYELADKLLARKADVNFHFTDQITCLKISCRRGRKDDIAKFLAFGADVNIAPESGRMPLMSLARNNQWDCVQVFVNCITDRDNDRRLLGFVLVHAIVAGKLPLALQLLALNAAADYRLEGNNGLHLAIKHNFIPIIKPLLLAGTNPQSVNPQNETAITLANAHDENARRENRYKLFGRTPLINIADLIAEVAAERAAASPVDVLRARVS
jgi:ankyrin repeat protein